jgi:hypothetical protein
MPRQDVTEILAANLHSLPHPDGRPRRLMHFSQFAGGGRDPKAQAAVKQLAVDVADAQQHLLEMRGFVITHKDDPKPADAEGYKTVRIKAAETGKEILEIGVDSNLTATYTRLARRSAAAALLEGLPE